LSHPAEEDTEEDSSASEDEAEHGSDSEVEGSGNGSALKKADSIQAKLNSKSSNSNDEFGFLDDINNSDMDSGNIASIKKYFGHKGTSTSVTKSKNNASKGKKPKASKFASSKITSTKDSIANSRGGGYSSGDNSDSDLEEGGYGNSARYDLEYGKYIVVLFVVQFVVYRCFLCFYIASSIVN